VAPRSCYLGGVDADADAGAPPSDANRDQLKAEPEFHALTATAHDQRR
jgi:hypothetical protein